MKNYLILQRTHCCALQSQINYRFISTLGISAVSWLKFRKCLPTARQSNWITYLKFLSGSVRCMNAFYFWKNDKQGKNQTWMLNVCCYVYVWCRKKKYFSNFRMWVMKDCCLFIRHMSNEMDEWHSQE